MKLVKDAQMFLGIVGLIIATIIIIISGYNDRSIVIATSHGNITTMDLKTGKIEAERNWWNESIRANDVINVFQIVVGHDDPMPELHLDKTEDAMIAQTTKSQG